MKRKILTADVRGFCSGVEHALAMVEKALKEGPFPIRVLHEIVHNDHVVEDFRERGVQFVEELDSSWCGGTLIFSAHGVSEALENRAKTLPVRLIDATCPIVRNLHSRVHELELSGKKVILIGKRSHREVVGTIGRMKNAPLVIENAEQARNFPVDPGASFACLTQTTLSVDDCAEIFDVLRARIPGINICGSVCSATSARQNAVKKLALECTGIIVIGSEKSSNSRRLREVAEKAGVKSCLIADASKLDPSFPEGSGNIGVTSGASAPEYLVRELVSTLEKSFGFEPVSKDSSEKSERF